MRITNNMLKGNYLNNLNNNLEKVNRLQTQAATGKRITKMSDDPVGVISVLQCDAKLNRFDQYGENIDNAQSWLKQTETSVLELNDIIKQAYETAVEMSSAYLDDDDKLAAAELVGQLRDHVITIGNSQSGDKYIFGGFNVTKTPFGVDSSGNILYNGLDLSDETNADLIAENNCATTYEVGTELTMAFSINGSRLLGMGDDNIYAVLDGLYNALSTGESAEEISGYIEKLQGSQSHVLGLEAEIGGKVNRLELISNRYEEDILNYTDKKSSIEDIDEAEAILNHKMAENVYTAALQIGSYIILPSLVEFLN